MNQEGALGERDVCCPFCRTPDPFPRYRYGTSAILACTACNLMWLHPRPDRDQLYELYGTMKYFTNSDFFDEGESHIYGYVDYMAERANKQYRYRKIVLDVKARLIQDRRGRLSPMSWLDVGCGLGFLLDVAFDEGFRVGGVEFNREAVDYIRAKYTFPVLRGPLEEVPIQGTYDVISLFDVVEHLPDPVKDLTRLRGVIAPGGYILIQTMDSRSFVSRLLGKKLEDFRRTREHLYFFSRKSLAAILDRSGWEVQEMKFIGQTFQLGALIDRFAVYSKGLSAIARDIVFPRWLLEANFYMNPGTKMLVVARAR